MPHRPWPYISDITARNGLGKCERCQSLKFTSVKNCPRQVLGVQRNIPALPLFILNVISYFDIDRTFSGEYHRHSGAFHLSAGCDK